MAEQLKAIYRLAGSNEVVFIEGQKKEGVNQGFVFSDFTNDKSFSISPEKSEVVDLNELNESLFNSSIQTEWVSSNQEDYDFGFTIIQNEIEHQKINKAILSRKKVFGVGVKVVQLFKKLESAYPNAHVFLTETPEGVLWIGATPETLLTKSGKDFETMSLAGTRAEGEEWTDKEYDEQRIVTNSILSELYQLDIDPKVSDLETIQAGAVFHLRNKVNFTADLPAQKIASVLHPTPAISGNPKAQAMTTIKIAENHDRDFYCGFGGPYELNGTTTLFVNLRCAAISANQIALYVGGGITKDSVLENETQECERKAQSILKFL